MPAYLSHLLHPHASQVLLIPSLLNYRQDVYLSMDVEDPYADEPVLLWYR